MSYLEQKLWQVYGMRLRNNGKGVGIEIEVEGTNLPAAIPGNRWSAVRDGSLRGESFEYVLKGPMNVSEANTALDDLEVAFKDHGSTIKEAHRGSVHVHVNVQDYTCEQIFTTIFLWLLVEPFWLRLCGETRDGNLFCLPSYLSGDLPEWSQGFLRGFRNGGFDFPPRGKYASLNTDAITNFGSLEFRTFSSHTSAKVVGTWVGWCDRLVQVGGGTPITNMGKVLHEAQDNPRKFLSTVFDKDTMAQYTDGDLSDIIEGGIDAASPMLVVARTHTKAKKA